MAQFRDRTDAGRQLAGSLEQYAGRDDVVVLALPRGGVPVGYEIARALGAPLDVFLVRKLGVPGQPELAMGAIASGGIRVLNQEVVRTLRSPETTIESAAREAQQELARREQIYRGDRPHPDPHGRIVILVDDGLATGSTMRAAVASLRTRQPARLLVAVPVAPVSTCESIRGEVDELVCLVTPDPFYAVGMHYDDFSQTTDDEVHDLLLAAAELQAVRPHSGDPDASTR